CFSCGISSAPECVARFRICRQAGGRSRCWSRRRLPTTPVDPRRAAACWSHSLRNWVDRSNSVRPLLRALGAMRGRRLSQRQQRKPLLGSGGALPVPFEAEFAGGTLLIASDGLFNYAAADRIQGALSEPDLRLVASRLVELVRLPSGALWDDIAVMVCRAGM